MKIKILVTLFGILLLFSCRRDVNSAVDLNGNVTTTKYTLDITLPNNLCGLISVDMIISHFDVQRIDLDLEDDYSKCGYSWKKPNFDELRERQINTVFEYAKKESRMSSDNEGDSSSTLSDAIKTESPYNTIQVGNFKKYQSLQDAVDRFTMFHRVPTDEEVNRLHEEMKKQIDKENKNIGTLKAENNFTIGISRKLKFKTIDGVGDQAFYDYLDRSLDVRYGLISFKVYLDSEKDLETNIEIAKELADAIWEKL